MILQYPLLGRRNPLTNLVQELTGLYLWMVVVKNKELCLSKRFGYP